MKQEPLGVPGSHLEWGKVYIPYIPLQITDLTTNKQNKTMKSNLTNRLLEICGSAEQTFGIKNLTEEQRLQIETELIQHFRFRKIVWMELPTGFTEDKSRVIVVQTRKILESANVEHTGEVGYLYTIAFSPKLYEPGELTRPVKDGCVFAPVVYDPKTYEPTQSITLTWSPEFPQDVDAPKRTYEDDKQMIRALLEKVLENPEDYRPTGYIAGILRYAV